MPRLHPTSALSTDALVVIARYERYLGIEPGQWQGVPMLRRVFMTLAVLEEADARMEADPHLSWSRAVLDAAAALGVSEDSILTRCKRARRAAAQRGQNEPTGKRAPW